MSQRVFFSGMIAVCDKFYYACTYTNYMYLNIKFSFLSFITCWLKTKLLILLLYAYFAIIYMFDLKVFQPLFSFFNFSIYFDFLFMLILCYGVLICSINRA